MDSLTLDQEKLLLYAVKVAKDLGLREGSVVSALTGIIGELSACKVMNAKWQPSGGFDAINQQGRRVSIKTRRRRKDRDKSPRLGRFRPNKAGLHKFDMGWYAELGEDFAIMGIWEAPKRIVLQLQRAEKTKGLPVRRFVKNSNPIWP